MWSVKYRPKPGFSRIDARRAGSEAVYAGARVARDDVVMLSR